MPGKLDGIGWFTFETLQRITLAHPDTHFYFLFDRKFNRDVVFGENVTPVILRPFTRHPILWYIWFQWRIRGFLHRKNPDLFLSTDGFIPLRSSTRSVAVIHDLNFEHRPGDLPALVRWYYRHFFPKFARMATRIVTVSEYSRRDIINQYEVDEDKVDLAYNGANDSFTPISDERAGEVRKQYTGGNPYFIFVGSLHPRKNICNLLKAFQLFKEENKGNYKMVLVGEKFFLTRPMKEQLEKMSHRKDVIFTGRLGPGELNELIGAAFAMTFVPYFEGFGIPLLEAMKCDVPVIASRVTSLPEIADEAAIYASPDSPASIRDAMMRLLREPGLREQLIEKGRSRRTGYSWDHTAEMLWTSIEKVLKSDA
ncbi:MAG: glycosyltransferase [Bacteroidetes bacterium]|nr:MAG: glycosyltransferase [Bacteroidota bacterium]